MKKLILLIGLIFVFSFVFVSAVPETNISYFYSTTCPHCANIAQSGILEKVSGWENVSLEKYEVTVSERNREKYKEFADRVGFDGGGIPFLVIEQNGGISYLSGDTPIIDGLENAIINFKSVGDDGGSVFDKLTLGLVVVSALIDSINPCAFGVLLFLMAVLLSMGSSKRALRAGLIYTFVIFVVYFLAGLGIMKFLSSFSILNNIRFVVGIFVFIGGLIEFKDFFWEGKGVSLKIPTSTKPLLEKFVRKGTLPAIIILGGLVALVELPCTGGVYLAILSLISKSGSVGIGYLALYNLIFILPLVLITYAIYRGAKIDSINSWIQNNKKYMRLAAGLIMVFLALALFGLF